MIRSVRLNNFLSFGDSDNIDMQSLNVIIGTNGSGKSNFLEAFDLLRNIPSDIAKPLREGGGVTDWLFKGENSSGAALLDFVVKNPISNAKYSELRYKICFDAVAQRFEIVNEEVTSSSPDQGKADPYIFYKFNNGNPVINVKDASERYLKREELNPTQSILAQIRDLLHYPEITALANEFQKIRIYREWSFGRYTPPRLPQRVDLIGDYLEDDCRNLGLVLNQINNDSTSRKRLIQELQLFYRDVESFNVSIDNNSVQILFQERGLKANIPASRLSDGTLRYLCLLAILCHPTPPPLVCIEEPELGMHPDVLPNLANLLKYAAEKSQLIVTTHSASLVDCFHNEPEAIMVAEKNNTGTILKRLDKEQLKPWLDKYRLGELWTRGDIGGNRW